MYIYKFKHMYSFMYPSLYVYTWVRAYPSTYVLKYVGGCMNTSMYVCIEWGSGAPDWMRRPAELAAAAAVQVADAPTGP